MKNTSMQKISRVALLPLFLLLCSLPVLFGCQSAAAGEDGPPPLPHAKTVDPPPDGGILSANTYAGDAIANMLLRRMSSGSSILSASMVEMDRLDQSSTFGRVAMQQVSSRVAQHGFRVIDVHLTEAMIINNNGEFMLSRDVCKILADKHNAYAVLVGVYTPAGSKLYVSVRALRLSDAAVIAAYEYYLPLSGETFTLLGSASGGGYSASGDPVWSRYAVRGQAFANCPPQRTAAAASAPVAPVAAAPAPPAYSPPPASPRSAPAAVKPAPKAAPKATAGKKSSGKKRRAASRGASPRQQYSPPAQPQQAASYSGKGEPICPQDVPSNRRITPDDCNRSPSIQSQGPVVYGDPYVDRGGGRVVNPSAPPPAVGRAY